MRVQDIRASFIKYQESIKDNGLRWIDSNLQQSEYLDYTMVDLYEAIKEEENEHIKSVLMTILYLKAEKKSKTLIPSLSLIYTRK